MSTHRTFLLVLLLAAGLVPARLSAQHHSFRRYGPEHGLAGQIVTALAQDARGFVWLGTEHGLDRFDGRRFVPFFLPDFSSGVHALAADGDVFLFAGTDAGVRCIRLSPHADDVPDRRIDSLLGTVHGRVYRLALLGRGSLHIESDAGCWDADYRAMKIHPAQRMIDRIEAPDSPLPRAEFRVAAHDAQGRTWYATSRGLLCAAPEGWLIFDTTNGLASTDVRSVLCDLEGNIWAGTSDGVFIHTPDRTQSLRAGRELPAGLHGVQCVAEAADGAVWIGTRASGALRLSGSSVRRFSVRDGLPSDHITAVFPLGSAQAVFATAAGLTLYQNGRVRVLTTRDGFPSDNVSCLIPSSRGGYWVGTTAGLAHWDRDTVRLFTTHDGLPSNRIAQIAEDRYGDVWIATDAGACTITRSAGDRISSLRELRGRRLTAVFVDRRNEPWFGVEGAGVFTLHNATLLSVSHEEGLPGRTITFISQDRHGTMYFGTNAGVAALAEASVDYYLPYDSTLFMWGRPAPVQLPFLRNAGLFSLRLPSDVAGCETMSGAAMRDSAGNMWFGSTDGLTRYTPFAPSGPGMWHPAGMQGRDPHRIICAQVQVGDTPISDARSVELDPDNPVLLVRCLLPSFRTPDQVRFFYRMEGLEYTWHESADGRVVYTGLRPGRYTLVLRATIGEGIWLREQDVLKVTVQTPLAERTWFQISALLAAAAAGWFLHRTRARRASA